MENAQPQTLTSRRWRHVELLLTLIVLHIGHSFLADERIWQRSLFSLLFLFVVISAIRNLSRSRTRQTIACIAAVFAFVLAVSSEFYFFAAIAIAVDVCLFVIFSLLILTLAETVFAKGSVDVNRIASASCIYFLLALVFAMVFAILETAQPGSFQLTERPPQPGWKQNVVSELIYFSDVTLTTVGYGDIVPISRPARSIATFEAMIAQLYLAIVMARLVGLHISQHPRDEVG